MKVGVLALQGAFREHREVLDALGVEAVEVRTPPRLGALDALILPGGESTTMSKLLDSLRGRASRSARCSPTAFPVLGTCAGMILLAREVLDGRPDQRSFGAIDVLRPPQRLRPPARLVRSGARRARARRRPVPRRVHPRATRGVGRVPAVEVLATHDDVPVLMRSGSVWVSSFHPELSGDLRIHQLFVNEVIQR